MVNDTDTTAPIAHVISSRAATDGHVTVVIECPHCKGEHTHGGKEGQRQHGHRVSHCFDKNHVGYDIVDNRPSL